MHLLADTATWIALGVALGAAVLALGACLVVLVLVFRRRSTAADEPARAEGPGAAEPESTRAAAPAETARAKRLSAIASSIDLDTVLERTLAAATATDGVDAAMAVVSDCDDAPLVATLGMSAEEAARQPVSSSPSGGARSVRISYRYGGSDVPPDEPANGFIGGGLAVPLREERIGTIGTLAVFWRGQDRVPGDDEITELEALARASAPAIRNAQELREARLLTDIDAVTGIHNRRYFSETLTRECARARRYERGLALLVLEIDDFEEMNERLGRPAGDDVLAAVAQGLLATVRESDVACRIGGDEFAVILPEAGARDAEQLLGRIQSRVGSGAVGPAESVSLTAGIAELRPEDDSIALFQRADDALYETPEDSSGDDQVIDQVDQVERPQGLPHGLPSGWAD
jgi:diguanylate cyclase (GGDEF)-like protein